MGSDTLYLSPCIIMQDGAPGDKCKALETVTEAMLNTSPLRIRLCKTLLDTYGYKYGLATISGPAQRVYIPGKLIEIITPHWSKRGRVETWQPSFSVQQGEYNPSISFDFQMTVKILSDQ